MMKLYANRFSNFDHSFFTAEMLLEVWMGFSSSVVIFCEWDLWIILSKRDVTRK